jgi:hypothetical protein
MVNYGLLLIVKDGWGEGLYEVKPSESSGTISE